MLYHVSPIKGIKVLLPSIATHKKPYVYAIKNIVTGVLFGVKQDDFDFIISTDEKDNPIVFECYPEALVKKYSGKSCYVYEVKEDGFLRGVTSWNPELVCEKAVDVIKEIEINDIYTYLLEEEKKGNIRIHRYEYNDEYRGIISKHIVDRLIRFEIEIDLCLEGQDKRFNKYYGKIIQELIKMLDGHLLI